MSVIFNVEGLEAVFTFLRAGSADCAVRPSAAVARAAKEDLRTLRRLNLPEPNMCIDHSPELLRFILTGKAGSNLLTLHGQSILRMGSCFGQ
jgi:hypothetical protein